MAKAPWAGAITVAPSPEPRGPLAGLSASQGLEDEQKDKPVDSSGGNEDLSTGRSKNLKLSSLWVQPGSTNPHRGWPSPSA